MRKTTIEEERAEAQVRARWGSDRKLRADFGDDLGAAVAYSKAEARGAIRIHGGGIVRGQAAAPSAELPGGGQDDPGAPSASPSSRRLLTPGPAGASEEDFEKFHQHRWNTLSGLRANFESFEIYLAKCRSTERRGRGADQ